MDIVIITNTMDSIIRLIRIWKLYVSMEDIWPTSSSQALAGDDRIRAEGQHEHHHRIHAELHEGLLSAMMRSARVKSLQTSSAARGEFLFFVFLAHIALHDAHSL